MKSKKIKVEIRGIDGNWINGGYGDLDFEAKIYTKPSKFGIDNGHVSKFHLYDAGIAYDRGWIKGEEKRNIWGPLVSYLNNFAQSEKFEKSLNGPSRDDIKDAVRGALEEIGIDSNVAYEQGCVVADNLEDSDAKSNNKKAVV